MGEQDDPVVADEVVEPDLASRGLGFEVGGNGAKAEAVVAVSTCSPAQSIAVSKTPSKSLQDVGGKPLTARVCQSL